MTYCSSLLDVLADRKGKNGVSGTVLINGRRRPKNFKCVAGYVVQVCVCVCVVQDIYIYIYIIVQACMCGCIIIMMVLQDKGHSNIRCQVC